MVTQTRGCNFHSQLSKTDVAPGNSVLIKIADVEMISI